MQGQATKAGKQLPIRPSLYRSARPELAFPDVPRLVTDGPHRSEGVLVDPKRLPVSRLYRDQVLADLQDPSNERLRQALYRLDEPDLGHEIPVEEEHEITDADLSLLKAMPQIG